MRRHFNSTLKTTRLFLPEYLTIDVQFKRCLDKAILTDSSPPEAGQVYDSDVHEVGLDFLGVDNRVRKQNQFSLHNLSLMFTTSLLADLLQLGQLLRSPIWNFWVRPGLVHQPRRARRSGADKNSTSFPRVRWERYTVLYDFNV